MAEISSAKLSINPDLLPHGPQTRVIDVGCGDGRHLRAAAVRGCRAVGVDYDAAEARRTRALLRDTPADLVVADASHLPFRASAVDAVICTETFEHLPNDGGTACEIARVLRAGGTLLGAVPSHFTEVTYWRLSRGYREAPGGHLRIYCPHALITMLDAAGLRVEGVRYAHFVDSIIWLRFCLADFLRRSSRQRTDYESAILLAVAAARPIPPWRAAVRRALARSRFIAALDAAGALIWPKSLLFVARKRANVPSSTFHPPSSFGGKP